MYVLDTDILSLMHVGHARLQERGERVEASEIGTTIVTRVEILRGRIDFLLKAKDGRQLAIAQHWLHRSEELLSQIVILPFDSASLAEFDRLLARRSLKKLGRPDLLIASIVLARRDVLVTRNLKHFQRIPGLRVENWAD